MQRSRTQMFGLLDDIGQGIMKSAASTVTGMEEEERDALIQKLMGGQMDFNDYITMSVMMQRQGGSMGILNTINNIGGMKEALGMADDVDTEDAEDKMQKYSKIVGAMTEEQRANPGYFTVGSGAEKNVAKLVETCEVEEVEEATVKQFLKEFSRMKGFFLRIGAGMREGKSQEELGQEMELWMKEVDEAALVKPNAEKKVNLPYINPARAEKKAEKLRKQRERKPPPPPSGRKYILQKARAGEKGNLFTSGKQPRNRR